MTKNFEEKTLVAQVTEFVTASNKHGEYARKTFAMVISYSLRIGRMEIMNKMFNTMTNGGDKAAFTAGLDIIRRRPELLIKDQNDLVMIRAANTDDKPINLFKVSVKDGMTTIDLNKDDELAKLFKRKLVETYPDDESMTEAFEEVFTSSNKKQSEQASRVFDSANYMLNVVKQIIAKETDQELAKGLAHDLNKVLKVRFGKEKALNDKDIDATIDDRSKEQNEKLQEAIRIAKEAGYDLTAPKPEKVIDHVPVKNADEEKVEKPQRRTA